MIDNKRDGSGERLKKLRKAAKKTQMELAEIIQTSNGHISDMEKERKNISDRTMALLELKINANLHWLRTGEGEMFRHTNSLSLDELAQMQNLNAFDLKIIRHYMTLDSTQRQIIQSFFNLNS